MNPQQREQIRLGILRYCLLPISEGLIRAYLRGDGFTQITAGELELQLRYLAGKGLLESPPKTVSPEVKHWSTTASGMDYLAEQRRNFEYNPSYFFHPLLRLRHFIYFGK